MNVRELLEAMIGSRASDLHVKIGSPPILRVDGKLQPIEDKPSPTSEDMQAWLEQLLSARQRTDFEAHHEVDFSFGVPGLARFRANVFQQRGTLAMAFRHVPMEVPRLEVLGLPPVVREQAFLPRGLVLVTGPTGVGKSTTLAAMVDTINREVAKNIITIEDPIEFLHKDRLSCVHQREVGVDTSSFTEGLRHILRQDPDVILVGEIRDRLTMETVLMAADTGHLVFSTLHTTDSVQTVQRILSFFPPHQHDEVRRSISTNLRAVICQRLIPRVATGRVVAVEALVTTPTVQEILLHPDKLSLLPGAIQEGHTQYGMQTFDQSVMALFKAELISEDEALRACTNPSEFLLHLKGIQATSDRRWQAVERGLIGLPTSPGGLGGKSSVAARELRE